MESNQSTPISYTIKSTALLSLVGHLSDFPNPDDPNPPGPWGPVIRRAAERVRAVLAPFPESWRELPGPVPDPWRVGFAQALAQEAVDRAMLMQEVADALPQAGANQGIIIIGGFLSRFVDDCGNGRIKHIFPPPLPHGGDRLASIELMVMAAQMDQSASATDNEGVRAELSQASSRLLDLAVGRFESALSKSAG